MQICFISSLINTTPWITNKGWFWIRNLLYSLDFLMKQNINIYYCIQFGHSSNLLIGIRTICFDENIEKVEARIKIYFGFLKSLNRT